MAVQTLVPDVIRVKQSHSIRTQEYTGIPVLLELMSGL